MASAIRSEGTPADRATTRHARTACCRRPPSGTAPSPRWISSDPRTRTSRGYAAPVPSPIGTVLSGTTSLPAPGGLISTFPEVFVLVSDVAPDRQQSVKADPSGDPSQVQPASEGPAVPLRLAQQPDTGPANQRSRNENSPDPAPVRRRPHRRGVGRPRGERCLSQDPARRPRRRVHHPTRRRHCGTGQLDSLCPRRGGRLPDRYRRHVGGPARRPPQPPALDGPRLTGEEATMLSG